MTFCENFEFLRKFRIFAKISNFGENFGNNYEFWRKFRILAKISNFDEILTKISNFQIWPKISNLIAFKTKLFVCLLFVCLLFVCLFIICLLFVYFLLYFNTLKICLVWSSYDQDPTILRGSCIMILLWCPVSRSGEQKDPGSCIMILLWCPVSRSGEQKIPGTHHGC